ncbi:hypothetical protein [Amycolatopsis plumensis]|uniref:Uncharacterized protein n=1 Tax=Amycolatopsis plumensis TaxID=236508 RepID=A0ABV5U7F6_9PSEU
MFETARRRQAIRRVKPGNGRPLQRFRWWHLPMGRGLFYLRPSPAARRTATYAVDVRRWGGEPLAHLYLNDRHQAQSRIPTVFSVKNGVIEVAMSRFGIKRCHFVTAGGGRNTSSIPTRSRPWAGGPISSATTRRPVV